MTARILVVDDITANLRLLEAKLQGEYYEVALAQSGAEALRQATSWSPDIILLDVMMPGCDGFEVARRVRNIEGLEDTRIIFLTARGTQADKVKGYSTGGEYYLTKPFDNEELIGIVNELVEFG